MLTKTQVRLEKANRTLHVRFTHEGLCREAFWFKVRSTGDLVFAPSLKSAGVLRGISGPGGSELRVSVADLPALRRRNHVTLHPSALDDPAKARPVANIYGGAVPSLLDLRKMDDRAVFMVHGLTDPKAYPVASPKAAGPLLHNLYSSGAPQIRFTATPLEQNVTVGRPYPRPRPGSFLDFVVQNVGPESRSFLFHLEVEHESSQPWYREHILALPS